MPSIRISAAGFQQLPDALIPYSVFIVAFLPERRSDGVFWTGGHYRRGRVAAACDDVLRGKRWIYAAAHESSFITHPGGALRACMPTRTAGATCSSGVLASSAD